MKVEHTHETVCDNNFVSEYVCVKKSVDLLSLFFGGTRIRATKFIISTAVSSV